MKKGFTLIELLIVIAILAILATAVVLVLNPAQILAQARDSQRISDLGNVKSAIALYLATATSATMTASTTCTATGCTANCFASTSTLVVVSSTVITGAGWVGGINFQSISAGSPLGALPLDPKNDSTYYYAYRGSTAGSFKLGGRLESSKYRTTMTTDGGIANNCPSTFTEETCFYEIGTNLAL